MQTVRGGCVSTAWGSVRGLQNGADSDHAAGSGSRRLRRGRGSAWTSGEVATIHADYAQPGDDGQGDHQDGELGAVDSVGDGGAAGIGEPERPLL